MRYLILILFLASCTDKSQTEDNRTCLVTFDNSLQVRQEAEQAGFDITNNNESLTICGNSVSVDAIVAFDDPEKLAEAIINSEQL